MTEQPAGAETVATLMGNLLLSCGPKLSVVWGGNWKGPGAGV